MVAGVLATALAFGVQTWAQQVIPAANIAVILTLEPVFAWLTAFLVLKEKLKLRPGMGAILVLLGIVTAEILPAGDGEPSKTEKRLPRGRQTSRAASNRFAGNLLRFDKIVRLIT